MTSSSHVNARRRSIEALADTTPPNADTAALLDDAARAISDRVVSGDHSPTAQAIAAYAEALRSLAELERWESDTLAAAPNAERHRHAAQLRASRAAEILPSPDPLCDPLRTVLAALAGLQAPGEHRPLRAQLREVPLPVQLIEPGRTPAIPMTGAATREPQPAARGAVLVRIAGSPITFTQAVTAGAVHTLEVEARVLDWPPACDRLIVRFLSRWPRSAIEATDVLLERPAAAVDGVWTAVGSGHLVLHAGAADPLTPITLAINAELTDGEATQPLTVLGESELALRTFDPNRDVVTGAPVVDARILEMLAELRESGVAPEEQAALGRFFGAVVRAGVGILADREFPAGSNPVEADFHRELLKRLRMATELGGRVANHTWQGGGPTDLVHDGIIAELKIDKTTPVTLENAKQYLGQPTQYASAGQRQLSILSILDMTPMTDPPGVLPNTMGWLLPRLHGLEDPAYPSRVAVVIIKGNLPVPSEWSR